ncbi:predicted protein [Arabidopsis lyrata subsp. lyrata]|uniref:Predicted protein n=1 Tax=Arabidopsis lyrata subsp. lyrata TaxID=81972 RepID=D7L5W3_ARALL|nr:predicted protein [Arabidopsis lyrata subsp. lyrata]
MIPTNSTSFISFHEKNPLTGLAPRQASLTAGDNLGPLLAPCLVSLSRAHGISFFWVKFSLIEILSRFGSSNFPPTGSFLMCCLYCLIGRGLRYSFEIAPLNWLCKYILQILRRASFDENLVSLTLCLVPVRLEFMEPSSTSQCLLIRTIHHVLELIANVFSTSLGFVCDLVLYCPHLRFLLDMLSNYLPFISLFTYDCNLLVSCLVLAKTLSSGVCATRLLDRSLQKVLAFCDFFLRCDIEKYFKIFTEKQFNITIVLRIPKVPGNGGYSNINKRHET